MAIIIFNAVKISRFLTNYIADYTIVNSSFSPGHYINFYTFLLILLVIILLVFVISVMFVKKKPKKLYIFNLAVYVFLIVLYAVDYNILSDLYNKVLDVRFAKALRDVNYIALAAQIVSLFMTLIRATGFDLKSFDFGKDLQELEINVKDNEEFEVAVEFDKNKARRGFRNRMRHFKYVYIEHKFIVNVSLIILLIVMSFIIFFTRSIYVDNHKEGQTFSASTLGFNVKNSYLIKSDQDGKTIVNKDSVLVVVKLDVRKFSEDIEKNLNTGLITLRVAGSSYSQTLKYNDYLTDIGTPYVNDELSTEFTSYLLTFEIPKTLINREMTLKINDNVSYVRGEIGAKNIYVKLKPVDLTKKGNTESSILGDTVNFSGSLVGDSILKINKIDISNKFKIEYKFCYKKDKCITSYEYVTPTATGNYFKTLMRIDGKFEEDESVNLDNIGDLFSFLNNFASIHYQIGGTWYEHKIDSKRIKPKVGKDNYVYVEVNKDLEKATAIYLTFDIRNYSYKYVLK